MMHSLAHMRKQRRVIAAVFCCLFFLINSAHAQEERGRIRLQGSLMEGVGIDDITVASNADGDKATVSGGGGFGGALTLGFDFSPRFAIDFTGGYRRSELDPDLSNASATFSREFYLITFKYMIPRARWFRINVGAGGGLYVPNELDVDGSQLINGAHNIISYDNAFGAHLITEFDFFVARSLAVNIGIRYSYVTYKETYGTRNGQRGYFAADDIKNLDGSGVDFILSFAKFF